MFHVIDDMKFVSGVVSEILREMGHSALEFNCPRDYLAYVDSPAYQEPRAVFTDILMPLLNGYEMIDELSRQRSDLTFVIMSAGAADGAERAGGSCRHLNKPFRFDEIKNLVDDIMRATASPQ